MEVITIVGPTAVGKTALALKIAEHTSGEIISADSRQIYKYLNIGTAKPTSTDRRKTPFHLIDFIEPDENYSCGQFARDAEKSIADISSRNKDPIICGGTGLYIRALFHPLHPLPQSDKKVKSELVHLYKTHGIAYLYEKLQNVDPLWASRIASNDKQRVIRGLEVYEITGKPLSEQITTPGIAARYRPLYIGLKIPRDELYERINARFDNMIEQGLLGEVTSLLDKGYEPHLSALRTIGYKEIIEHLHGKFSLDEAIMRAKRRTRNYAKRQITWFSRLPGIQWFHPDNSLLCRTILNVMK